MYWYTRTDRSSLRHAGGSQTAVKKSRTQRQSSWSVDLRGKNETLLESTYKLHSFIEATKCETGEKDYVSTKQCNKNLPHSKLSL